MNTADSDRPLLLFLRLRDLDVKEGECSLFFLDLLVNSNCMLRGTRGESSLGCTNVNRLLGTYPPPKFYLTIVPDSPTGVSLADVFHEEGC